ncbi:MAG: hypothetical protein WB392_02060 [Methanotrichaceae archaeon]
MKWSTLIKLILMYMLVSNASALEIKGTGEGYFLSEAHNTAGFQAEAWAYSVDGHLKGDPYAQADIDHAEASVKGFASTNKGYVESGTLSTNNITQSGIGTITNASINGSGTIGMDYLESVDVNLSYQSATANSANVNSYVDTNLSLDQGKASVDSYARDESGNYARVVALAGPSAWIGTTQTVSIDPTSTSATMDIFGTSRDSQGATDAQNPVPYLSAYSGSGNTHGNTSVQYTISRGYLNTEGVVGDATNGYIVPSSPSASSMKAYSDNQTSIVDPDGAGKINFAQDDAAAISSQAVSNTLGFSKWNFYFVHGEGNITGTATQDAFDTSAQIY